MGRARNKGMAVSTTYVPLRRGNNGKVGVHTHDQLFAEAASIGPFMSLGSTLNSFGNARSIREALGVQTKQKLAVHLLLDRSGSVLWDKTDSNHQLELAQAISRLAYDYEANDYTGATAPTDVAIEGFDGGDSDVSIYQVKPYGVSADRALLTLTGDLGGGGTPTGAAVEHATAELLARDEGDAAKLLVVVVDGIANNNDKCGRAVDAAREKGIRVIGVYKEGYPSPEFMTEGFADDWFAVKSYLDVPTGLEEHLQASPSVSV